MSDRIRQTGRLIYLLALFQLAGGPLVIGGVLLVGEIIANWSRSDVALKCTHTEEASLDCEQAAATSLSDRAGVNPTDSSKPLLPEKAKDTKGKLWGTLDAGGRTCVSSAAPLIACLPAESEWRARRSHPPPIPPPRAV